MNYYLLSFLVAISLLACSPRLSEKLSAADYNKDVLLQTSKGEIRLRLNDATPLHRDNFLRLVKSGFYDSIQFHRVINQFMIQAGNPATRPDSVRGPKPGHLIAAEFRPELFHRKGALAAARTGDDVNPSKASSSSQFYIVQGRTFTDAALDSVETHRLKGRKIPAAHREVYKSTGGAPHLDQNYTIFGEVLEGLPVVDSIASVPTTGTGKGDRPLNPVYIKKARLIKRSG